MSKKNIILFDGVLFRDLKSDIVLKKYGKLNVWNQTNYTLSFHLILHKNDILCIFPCFHVKMTMLA